jgi:hypothetical protein
MRNMALNGSTQMKHPTTSLIIGACLLFASAGVVFATDAHKVSGMKGQNGTTGQGLNQTSGAASCGGAQSSPPGQANNPDNNSPFPTAGNPSPTPNYAGAALNPGSPSNTHANSQYDNACFQQMP